jgi:multisubunit Na+/H+ antiporter MnhC subunit
MPIHEMEDEADFVAPLAFCLVLVVVVVGLLWWAPWFFQ